MVKTSDRHRNDELVPLVHVIENINVTGKSNRSSIAKKSFVQDVQLGEKIGVFGVMLTLVGTIVGGGIVGIPYATLQTGIWLVLVVHACNFVWGIYSIHLLLEAKNMSGLASFSELGFYAFGRASIFIINGLIAIAQVGMPIIYFMIIGDIGQGLLQKIDSIDGTFWADKQFPILIAAVVLFYFAIKKEIQELKGVGFILLVGVVLFIFAMIILLITKGTKDFSLSQVSKPKFNLNMLANVPTLFISYAFQSGFFPAYQGLKNKTDANGIKSVVASLLFVMIVYVIVSVVALLKFGTGLEDNMLKNVSSMNGWIPIVISFVFLIIVAMHIPIVLFVGKESLLIMLDELMRKTYSTDARPTIDTAYGLRDSIGAAKNAAVSEGKAYLTMHPVIFYGFSIMVYCLVVTAACLLNDITLVFGIIGSISGSYIIFIAPAQFYLMSIHNEGVKVAAWRKVLAWIFMIFGCFVTVICLFATIYTAAA
jgi:amino acid permease